MQTSNFARSARHPDAVAIARGLPPWYHGLTYEPLAPPRHWLSLPTLEYHRRFMARMEKLSPHQVMTELGENAVLLCWESPNVLCHRRYVAEWLEERVGMVIPELGFPRSECLTVDAMVAVAIEANNENQMSLQL